MATTAAGAASTSSAILELLDRNRAAEARLHAERYELIERLRQVNIDEMHLLVRPTGLSASAEELLQRVTASEVSLTLQVHERTAGTLIAEAQVLADDLTAAHDGLRSGRLTPSRVRELLSAVRSVPQSARRAVEAHVLRGPWNVSASAWRRRCSSAVERHHPTSIDERHRVALGQRRVAVSDGGDCLSWVSALLPRAEAELIHAVLTGTAQEARIAGDERTLDHLRADAFRDAVLGIRDLVPTSSAEPERALRTVRARVSITVPALSLLGRGDDLSSLEGLGPIPGDVARALAGNSRSWRRILTDPWSGAHLALGRTSYRVPAALRRWVEHRATTCSHPQCSVAAARCDLDHVVPWSEGGETSASNLAATCERHHNLRHHSAFDVAIDQVSGDVIWFDPAGNAHRSPPFDGEPPDPPDLSGIADLWD